MNRAHEQVEGEDFELVPVGDNSNNQAWNVRVLSGDYVETVIVYGNIQFDGEADQLKFSFSVVTSPTEGLTSEDQQLQVKATFILETILENAHNDGSLVTGEEVGNSIRTDDTEESTD
tara:strand:- start:25391 stop:25744 length:354 start_codon:yes stop_codon:yes gene_type:complete